jgi:hypothetical protein
MKYRFAFLAAALVAVLASLVSRASAQELSAAVSAETAEGRTTNIAFSKDGRILREIQVVSPAGLANPQSVRAITYDATTGSIRHVLNLGPNTKFLSATLDGRTAIISVNGGGRDAFARLLLVDTETGQTLDIPSKWFNAEDHYPHAQISADGRFVSAYSKWGPEDGPLVVTLYDWRTKRLVAKRSEGYPAGGISRGGVTVDGKIEFVNNRVGGNIVDPKTGRLLATVGPNSHRSPDGAWDVEFPNPMYEDEPVEVIIMNGRSGKVFGKLDLRVTEYEENWAWGRGAYCGTSRRFIAASNESVQAFEIPSGKHIANFPIETWRAANRDDASAAAIACSPTGKRVAIRSGERLTLHVL